MPESVASDKVSQAKEDHMPRTSINEDADHTEMVKSKIPDHLVVDPNERQAIEKRLKWKLDLRCSLFVVIYIMNYLDRNNIGAARLRGLQEELNLDNTEYATCLSILYVGYVLTQVPSNILINRISRPSYYIGAAMFLWGLISTLTGCVHNFAGMVVVRFFLGFVEAVFLPGALLILTKWYTRRELTKRNAVLFCGNLIANAFSGLIGAGVLSNMQGSLGHSAWRWLFWIEGAATMFIAFLSAFILPDLPHNTRGFSQDELRIAQLRMIEDIGEPDADSNDEGTFAGLVMAIKDGKIYLMMLATFLFVVGLTFNAYFPTLTQTLGFSYVPTLLMSAPPWVFASIVSLANAWHADKTQEMFWHISGPLIGGIVGFIISMSTLSTAARYVALFLQASSYAGWIVIFSWVSSSFPRPPAKRAVAIAMINSLCQLGNVAGSYIWDLDANGYRSSYGIVLAMFSSTIVCLWGFRYMLVRMNKELENEEASATTVSDEKEDISATHGFKKGFRYLL